MDLNAAATSAHVARRIRNLITDRLRIFYVISWHRSLMVSSTAVDTNSADAVLLDLVVSLTLYFAILLDLGYRRERLA
jgi:hypothetical protein